MRSQGISPQFLAVIEATQEDVDDPILRATSISGRGHTAEALPLRRTEAALHLRTGVRGR